MFIKYKIIGYAIRDRKAIGYIIEREYRHTDVGLNFNNIKLKKSVIEIESIEKIAKDITTSGNHDICLTECRYNKEANKLEFSTTTRNELVAVNIDFFKDRRLDKIGEDINKYFEREVILGYRDSKVCEHYRIPEYYLGKFRSFKDNEYQIVVYKMIKSCYTLYLKMLMNNRYDSCLTCTVEKINDIEEIIKEVISRY